MSKNLNFIFKKSGGREAANQKLYKRMFHFFDKEFSEEDTFEKTFYTIFMFAEIMDNYFDHDEQNFTYIKLDVSLSDTTKEVVIELEDDGSGYDPLSDSDECRNIKNASKKINHPAPIVGELKGSSDMINKSKFSYNLKRGV